MAIEVLLGIDHTYRHDLESFFYVLIWLCARHGWDFCGNPRVGPTKWYSGSFRDIAEAKRGILFPLLEDGALFKGNRPDPPKELYDPIIEAFEDAIEDNK